MITIVVAGYRYESYGAALWEGIILRVWERLHELRYPPCWSLGSWDLGEAGRREVGLEDEGMASMENLFCGPR